MNTFFPFHIPSESAKVLSNRHLNKQLVEAGQIYKALFCDGHRQGNPHAYTAWEDNQFGMIFYGKCLYDEWKDRFLFGKRGGVLLHKTGEYFFNLYSDYRLECHSNYAVLFLPTWTQNPCINAIFRGVLLHKDQMWYGQFGWKESPIEPNKRGSYPYPWADMKQ